MATVISCGNTLLTGSGAQLVIDFSTDGLLGTTFPDVPITTPLEIRSINDWQYDLPVIENSTLLTAFYDQTIPGDRIRLDPIEIELLFDPQEEDNRIDDRNLFDSANGFVPIGKEGVIYLYFAGTALATGTQTPARWYLSGCGFLRNWRMPRMEANVRQISRAQIQFSNRATTGSAAIGISPQPRWYQVPTP